MKSHWDHDVYGDDLWSGDRYRARYGGLDAAESTKPLKDHLGKIDALLHTMSTKSATPDDRLRQITSYAELLAATVHLSSDDGRPGPSLRLTEPTSVAAALRMVAGDVHLNVRVDPHTGSPAFLLFRVARSYFQDYSAVLEELYRSPQLGIDGDPRFVVARVSGRESWYLRLSPYRDAVARFLETVASTKQEPDQGLSLDSRVDRVLSDLARFAIGACWHDSQRVAARVADLLRIEGLVHTIELIYYANTIELEQIRRLDDTHVAVLRDHFNPLLGDFVLRARSLSGQDLGRLRDQAKKAYVRLQRAFGRLMDCEVHWGYLNAPMRLTFVVHANFRRLDMAADVLRRSIPVWREAANLKREAAAIAGELLAIPAMETRE